VVAEKLAAGASADAADGDGNTLLHLAVAGRRMDVIQVLHGTAACVLPLLHHLI
jgi:Ankyrin repeats (many copies)